MSVNGGETAAHVTAGEDVLVAAERFAKTHGLDDGAAPILADALRGARATELESLEAAAARSAAALETDGFGSVEGATWGWRQLASFLELVSFVATARRTPVSKEVIRGASGALRLLERSEVFAYATARKEVFTMRQKLARDEFRANDVSRFRLVAENAYRVANTTDAIEERDRADAAVRAMEDKVKLARRAADGVLPVTAVHRARENALLATLADARRETDRATKDATARVGTSGDVVSHQSLERGSSW